MLNHEDLLLIAARSSTLAERIGGRVSCSPAEPRITQSRLERWRAHFEHSSISFEDRLHFDGVSVDEAAAIVGDAQWTEPLPGWTSVVADALERLPDAVAATHRYYDERPVAFQSLMSAFVEEGRARLEAEVSVEVLSERARVQFERGLLELLGQHAAPSLNLEFGLLRRRLRDPVTRLRLLATGETPTEVFELFVAQLVEDRMRTFFLEYSALARALGTLVLLWVETTREFIERFANDREALSGATGVGCSSVAAVTISNSDRHNGGRSVFIVTTDGGARVVYKPKSLGMAAAWFGLLEALSVDGPIDHAVPWVLVRDHYGWMEFVESRPCETAADVVRFFERVGSQLALLTVLEATDVHFENIIASGAYPVLVDAETLFHHRPKFNPGPSGWGAFDEVLMRISDSTLHTLLLPNLASRMAVFNGLSAEEEVESPSKVTVYEHLNTDVVRASSQVYRYDAPDNVPRLQGQRANVLEHTEALFDGFRTTCTLLMKRRASLRGPLSAFADLSCRFVLRPTSEYARLLSHANQPDYMRVGVERGILFDRLTTLPVPSTQVAACWGIVAHEQAAFARLDVPFYEVSVREDVVRLPDGTVVSGLLEAPSYDRALAKLDALDAARVSFECELMRTALYSSANAESSGSLPSAPTAHAPPETDDYVAWAAWIGQRLLDEAVRAPDGSVSWIAAEFSPTAERLQILPTTPALYSGAMGAALFLAALDHELRAPRFGRAALGSIAHVLRDLTEPERERRVFLGVGGACGWGSIVYGLTHMARLLERPQLLASAKLAAQRCHEGLEHDEELDLVNGSAGAVLGLLRLYEATGDDEVLAWATAFGDRLVAKREPHPAYPWKLWRTASVTASHDTPESAKSGCVTGMSHGAAGFGLALGRLANATGRGEFADAARDAVAFERAIFQSQTRSWPRYRKPGCDHGEEGMCSWCYGGPGIGISRTALADLWHDEGFEVEIRDAAGNALCRTEPYCDNLCCGEAGLAESLMLAANSRGGRPEWIERAHERMRTMFARARDVGFLQVNPMVPRELLQVGFFGGLSGIGYQCLRMRPGSTLPSVLRFD